MYAGTAKEKKTYVQMYYDFLKELSGETVEDMMTTLKHMHKLIVTIIQNEKKNRSRLYYDVILSDYEYYFTSKEW
jgi:hypothetical protein